MCTQTSAHPGGRRSRSGHLPALHTTLYRKHFSTTPGSSWWPPSFWIRPVVINLSTRCKPIFKCTIFCICCLNFSILQAGWPSLCFGSSLTVTRLQRWPGRPTGSLCPSWWSPSACTSSEPKRSSASRVNAPVHYVIRSKYVNMQADLCGFQNMFEENQMPDEKTMSNLFSPV